MVQSIDISGNKLNGGIPEALGSCTGLISLNLANNALQGTITEALSYLVYLMDLDLSSNALSGQIPKSLKKLKFLRYLNLSFNRLTGEVPEGGVSANATAVVSLIGNAGLCGPRIFLLPECPNKKSHSHKETVIVAVSSASAFVVFCLVLGLLWRYISPPDDLPRDIMQKLEHIKISYEELFSATGGFSESKLVGVGSFGSVYREDVKDGRVYAVKVLNLNDEEAHKSFDAECKVLRKVRHRNLTRIITSCYIPGFKALIFEFMPNGSLEKHLYPEQDDCKLGLKRRLDIAIDIANVMEYLHYNSSVQVVHCTQSVGSLTSTLSIKGSVGYIAPEYGLGGRVTTGGDVYSYGILLLEMLTRKRPTDDLFVGGLNLHQWVNSAFPNSLVDILDRSLVRDILGMEEGMEEI
ncbi:hypothetical protein SUGI_1085940 [Cryptomeria japonica]|nr:hypothetical protein SUGI_1085940 [Cryptomeria japonica]